MSILFVEREDSRKINRTVNSAKETLHFLGTGSIDQDAMYAAALTYAPLIFDFFFRQSIDLTPLGAGYWDVTVDYGFSAESQGESEDKETPDDSTALGPEFDFDITAQTAHITQSLATVRSVGIANLWASATPYAVGAQVTNNGLIYTCTTAGTSGGTGPTGTGSGITDGSCKWSFVGVGGLTSGWTTSTAYFTGGSVVIANGNSYQCTTSGTSAASGNGPSGTGSSIADGTCVWKYLAADTPLNGAAPNYNGAIGVSGSTIAGTDVFTGHMEFGVTVQVYPVTLPYLRTLLNAVGTTNKATWFNFPAGTLLYLGATGSCKPGSLWTMHHKWAAAPNITNIPIGSAMMIPLKRGWDYLWCTYRDAAIAAGVIGQVPAAAYVEQVYRSSDYSLLQLGM